MEISKEQGRCIKGIAILLIMEGVAKHTSKMKKASTFPSGGFVISVKSCNFTVQNY